MKLYCKNCGQELIVIKSEPLFQESLWHKVEAESCKKAELGVVEISQEEANTEKGMNYITEAIGKQHTYDNGDYSLKLVFEKDKMLIFFNSEN